MRLGRIDIRVMVWESKELSLSEFDSAMRHPMMLVFMAVTWIAKFPLRYRADSAQMSLQNEVMLYVASQLATTALTVLPLVVLSQVRWKRDPQPIYLSVIFFLGWFCSYGGAELLVGHLGLPSNLNLLDLVLWSLLFTVISEFETAFIMGFLSPHVVRRAPQENDIANISLRNRTSPPLVSIPEAAATAPELRPTQPNTLVVADQHIPIDRILRLTVESNYIEFVLTSGRVYLPFTMKQALASLSPEQGCLIHRSIWLANDNFESYRREGMELMVRTTDGLEFRVARSRHGEVLPWLKQQTFLRKAGLKS
jgi:hypothetical protein